MVNGHFYIGVTKLGLRIRRLQHLKEARRGKFDFPLYLAIRKYGEDSFVFVPLCECETYEEALTKEIELIALLRPAYNATKGGEGASYWTGKSRDAETNRKISITKTGVPRGYTPPHALEIFKENMLRAARNRQRPVVCLNDGTVYASAREAEKALGFSKASVARVARGNVGSIYGLRFEYVGVPN